MIIKKPSMPKLLFHSSFNIDQCRIKLQDAIKNHSYDGTLKNEFIKGTVEESIFTMDLFRSYPTRKHNMCHVVGELISDVSGTLIQVKFNVPIENILMCSIFLVVTLAIIIPMGLLAHLIGKLIFIPTIYLIIYTTLEFEYKRIRLFILTLLAENPSQIK